MKKVKKDYKQASIFIERTLAVLQQYEKSLKAGEQSYSHTLFINACVGLLMTTTEVVLTRLPTGKISKEDWGIDPKDVLEASLLKNHKDKMDERSVQNITRLMRNSIAHFWFTFDYDETKSIPIDKISFKLDKYSKFELNELDFSSFKLFVFKVAEESLKILKK